MSRGRVSVIGAGRIAGPVIAHLRGSTTWRLGLCLVRRPRDEPGLTADAARFFGEPADLIVEAAGPEALIRHGVRALGHADLWSTSAAALAAPALAEDLRAAATASGHRLRLLGGALGGLDGVAAAASDPGARLYVTASRPGLADRPGQVFHGPLAEAARLHPHEINFAVAAALAGPGIDRTTITLTDPGPGGAHVLGLRAESRSGVFEATHRLNASGGLHPVAATIIAALDQEAAPLRVG